MSLDFNEGIDVARTKELEGKYLSDSEKILDMIASGKRIVYNDIIRLRLNKKGIDSILSLLKNKGYELDREKKIWEKAK